MHFTRAQAFYSLGQLHAMTQTEGGGLPEFCFERHADFENYLLGRKQVAQMKG